MFVTFNQALSDMEQLRREIDSVFNRAWGQNQLAARHFPLINMYDAPEQLTLVAELPGLKKEDIEITYTEGLLKLSGRRELKRYAEKEAVLRQERNLGKFEKTVRIPVQIEAEQISASLEDGLLTVHLPKAEAAKPKQIQINA